MCSSVKCLWVQLLWGNTQGQLLQLEGHQEWGMFMLKHFLFRVSYSPSSTDLMPSKFTCLAQVRAPRNWVRISDSGQEISLVHSVSGARSASGQTDTRVSFSENKGAGASISPLTSIQCWRQEIVNFHVRLYRLVLNRYCLLVVLTVQFVPHRKHTPSS
jgi:hypothetical protein